MLPRELIMDTSATNERMGFMRTPRATAVMQEMSAVANLAEWICDASGPSPIPWQ